MSSLLNKVETGLPNVNLVCQKVTSGCGEEHSYLLHLIANMGETPPTFDMPPNRAINNTGEKTTKMRTTGNEKNRVVVVLA